MPTVAPPKPPIRPVSWALFGLRGRTSRQVYWLSYVLVVCLQSALLAQIIGAGEEGGGRGLATAAAPFLLAGSLYATFAIAVKRLHDVGYSGFLALAVFIPFVNLAFSIWLGILPGNAHANQYGSAPDRPA